MARKLTDKQMQTLRFIYDYIKSNDCAPTTREIAKALSISIGIVYSQVGYMLGYGYLREPETKQYGRNIALTEKGILTCEGEK